MTLSVEQKYRLYESSVQNPDADVDFISEVYRRHYGKEARVLREDFGGTGYLACQWVKKHPDNRAHVVDLDPEPIEYGKKVHYGALNSEQQECVTYYKKNVLDDMGFTADVVVAFNFSYFIFKKRQQLKEYFQKVYNDLPQGGMFCLDLFGGEDAYAPSEEATEHDNHTYYWDCDSFNPLTNECLYYIHFETHDDGIKHEKVFTYDWRLWSNAELKDILEEVGFSQVISFWEGEDEDGDGDGNFFETEEAENCESWVTYIAALKK